MENEPDKPVPDLPAEVIEVLNEGRIVEAIVRLRKKDAMSLAQAKDKVEAYMNLKVEGRPGGGTVTLVSKDLIRVKTGGLMAAFVLFGAFGWMIVNAIGAAGNAVVLAHAGGYRPATFVVSRVEYHSSRRNGLFWGLEGVVEGERERLFARELAETRRPGLGYLRARYPAAAELKVLYNPAVTATLFGGRTLRVIPYTDDLSGGETGRLAWWGIYCFLPFALAYAYAKRSEGASAKAPPPSAPPPPDSWPKSF